MTCYGLLFAITFLANSHEENFGSNWSSAKLIEPGRTVCPVKTGQNNAHDRFETLFTVSDFRAEDTGLEPATPRGN